MAAVAGVIVGVSLMAGAVAAVDLDLSDFDEDLMRSMDDAIKDLDSNLGGQNAQASLANAAVIRDGLGYAEKYFTAKPEAPRGVAFARDGQEQLTQLVKSIEAHDFNQASEHVRGLARSCKACHEVYKPPE